MREGFRTFGGPCSQAGLKRSAFQIIQKKTGNKTVASAHGIDDRAGNNTLGNKVFAIKGQAAVFAASGDDELRSQALQLENSLPQLAEVGKVV